MTNARFLPSAGLLLAIAACAPEFASTLPASVESFLSMSGWPADDGASSPPETTEPPGADPAQGPSGSTH